VNVHSCNDHVSPMANAINLKLSNYLANNKYKSKIYVASFSDILKKHKALADKISN